MSEALPQLDVVDILAADHRRIETVFAELEQLRGAMDVASLRRRKVLTEQVTEELVKHSVAEEAEVHPRILRRINREEADRLAEAQAEAERTMKRLEALLPDQADFDEELTTLIREIREIREHVEEEAFPSSARAPAWTNWSGWVRGSKPSRSGRRHVRTRPAPDRPPYAEIMGPPTGMIDRLWDALMSRNA